jgi:hypothetical protein
MQETSSTPTIQTTVPLGQAIINGRVPNDLPPSVTDGNKLGRAISDCIAALTGLSRNEKVLAVKALSGMLSLTSISQMATMSLKTDYSDAVKAQRSKKIDYQSSKKGKPVSSMKKQVPSPVPVTGKGKEIVETVGPSDQTSKRGRSTSSNSKNKKKAKKGPTVPNPANKTPEILDLKKKLEEVRSQIKSAAKDTGKELLPSNDPLVVKQREILASITLKKGTFLGFKNLEVSKGRELDPENWNDAMAMELEEEELRQATQGSSG